MLAAGRPLGHAAPVSERTEQAEPNKRTNRPSRPANRTEQAAPVALAAAPARLGISTDAVRMRVRRGQLAGVKAGRTWLVYLDTPAPAAEQPNRTGRTSEPNRRTEPNEPNRTASEQTEQVPRNSTPASTAYLLEEVTYLRAALEREQVANGELRRLLGNAQQQLTEQSRALLAAPTTAATPPLEAPESPDLAPASVETVQQPSAVEKLLKRAGLGKKARRKLLERLGFGG
jgi:hypothetical protein